MKASICSASIEDLLVAYCNHGIFHILAIKPRLDIAFIVGATGTNSEQRFKKQKKIMKHLLTSYDVSPGQTHVGIINNDKPTTVAMKFGEFSNDALRSKIDELKNPNSNMLLAALNYANDEMFTIRNQVRPGFKKSLVVFVNKGVDSDDEALKIVGRKLRDSNINVIVIGIDPEADGDKMKAIANLNDVFFFPPLLEELGMILYPIVRRIQPGKEKLFRSHLEIFNLPCFCNLLSLWTGKLSIKSNVKTELKCKT